MHQIIYDPERQFFWKQNLRGYCDLNSKELGHFSIEKAKEIVKNSEYGDSKQVQIALNPYCIDFLSNDQKRAGYYVLIYAENVMEAREVMFETYGDRWNCCYELDKFKDSFPPFMRVYAILTSKKQNDWYLQAQNQDIET